MFFRHFALLSILVNLLVETFLQNLFQTPASLNVSFYTTLKMLKCFLHLTKHNYVWASVLWLLQELLLYINY